MSVIHTSQITVRNVDAGLKLRINKQAKLKSMSINDFVLDTLRTRVNATGETAVLWHEFHGIMDRAAINQQVLDDFEKIDPEMWNGANTSE